MKEANALAFVVLAGLIVESHKEKAEWVASKNIYSGSSSGLLMKTERIVPTRLQGHCEYSRQDLACGGPLKEWRGIFAKKMLKYQTFSSISTRNLGGRSHDSRRAKG
jgi:hypothetical protein